MLCDKCKQRPACVHITKIINNQKTEQHLCDICAAESGDAMLTAESMFSVQDFLKGMFSSGIVPQQKEHNYECENCGLSYNDFSRVGKFGCSECYKYFGDQVTPLIRRIHGTRGHTGKVPKKAGGMLVVKQQLAQLREELTRCINNEEYEQAAVIRDRIKELEKSIIQD